MAHCCSDRRFVVSAEPLGRPKADCPSRNVGAIATPTSQSAHDERQAIEDDEQGAALGSGAEVVGCPREYQAICRCEARHMPSSPNGLGQRNVTSCL